MYKNKNVIGACSYEIVDGEVKLAFDGHFRLLAKAVREGDGEQKFPVGTQLFDVWRDTVLGISYEIPWVVADYREVLLADGSCRPGVILIWSSVLPFGMEIRILPLYSDERIIPSTTIVQQYLNSAAERGSWWSRQYEDEGVPRIAGEKDGFMRGCSDAILNVTADVIIHTATEKDKVEDTKCRFFIPSCSELNCAQKYNSYLEFAPSPIEGEPFKLFQTDQKPTSFSCSAREFTNCMGDERSYWTRSIEVALGYCRLGWYIKNDGGLDDTLSSSVVSVLPTCVIV